MKNVKISKGSIVKVWHNPNRGHEYVVLAVDEQQKKVHLLKNNCLNVDNTVHAATSRFHLSLPYINLGTTKVIKGITRVNKNKRDVQQAYLEPILSGSSRELEPSEEFICSIKPN